MLYLCRFKPLRHYLRGFLIAAWAGDKIAEFSFPEISFHFSLRPWFFFVSPAYAGKSPAAAYACPGTQDHPRVCGEKLYTPCVIAPSVGSPPRMRGKAKEEPYRPCHPGITPACAGKSVYLAVYAMFFQDHPRMCGEKKNICRKPKALTGSPPHVRGKERHGSGYKWKSRITPACAGKSPIAGFLLIMQRDHPRMCGEKASALAAFAAVSGSPPHVRGKGHRPPMLHPATGITPACAGKSTWQLPTTTTQRDHPRMCGEKCSRCCVWRNTIGSPPHVRGKAVGGLFGDSSGGITPACAGKSESGRLYQRHV